MASSTTTLVTVTSTATSSISSSTGSSTPQQNETGCTFDAINTTGFNGPICIGSIPPDFFNITTCAQDPSDIRHCGAYHQIFESKFQDTKNISMVQNETFTCIKNLLDSTARTSKSFSISCLNYENGVHVSGAAGGKGLLPTGSYDGAMGLGALMMMLAWSLNML